MNKGFKMGMRVGAVEKLDKYTVYIYGYGRYMGEDVPPREVSVFLHDNEIRVAKIMLDNGNVVWGCQCWWGAESMIKRTVGKRRVIVVNNNVKQVTMES